MRFLGLFISIFMFMVNVAHSACYNNCVTPPSCESMGYKLDISCPDGAVLCPFDTRYKWCKEYTCKDGRYYASANEVSDEKGYKCDEITYHGQTCFDCYCSPNPNECKWTDKNKGKGEISDPCCDGTFAVCKNPCADTVTVPQHASPVKTTCEACGISQEVTTDWKCNEHYDKMENACYAHPCEDGYSTANSDISTCGEHQDGWDWKTNGMSGEQVCGLCTAKPCADGFDTDKKDLASCGVSGGWEFESNGYSGDEVCGKCTAKACAEGYDTSSKTTQTCGTGSGWEVKTDGKSGEQDCTKCECVLKTECKWDDTNKGSGELSEECCNHKYAKCENKCQGITVPEHATGTSPCTACEETKYTDFTCNEGYLKLNGECVEQCKEPQVDYDECWDGSFKDKLKDCEGQGYKDTKGSCNGSPSIACPLNPDKVRCLKM